MSSSPEAEFCNPRGFQNVVGAQNSDVRSRALEAYRLGLIQCPLISQRSSRKAGIPLGWQMVIQNQVPHTTSGYFAYVIGKLFSKTPLDPLLNDALDCLTTIQILHLGFQLNDRWYTTASVFHFAKLEIEQLLERELSQREFRYLSAAVINTLESDESSTLLSAYRGESELEFLYFDIEKSRKYKFSISELSEISRNRTINVNHVKKKKASLFWSQPSRGIYSRAVRSVFGFDLISEFCEADRDLCFDSSENLLAELYQSINSHNRIPDIFQLAEREFQIVPRLLDSFHLLTFELERATNSALESIDISSEPRIFQSALSRINSPNKGVTESIAASLAEVRSQYELNLSSEYAMQAQIPVANLTNEQTMSNYIHSNFERIFDENPPRIEIGRKSVTNKLSRSKLDYESIESERKLLGSEGEKFVFLYEQHRLKSLGMHALADKVVWVSQKLGDGYGYDILSFDESGEKILVEVKATKGGKTSRFYLSANELEVSREKPERFLIYRLYDFPKNPRIFVIRSPLEDYLVLQPTNYRASPK